LVVVTMDTHFASSFNRANAQLKKDFPGPDLERFMPLLNTPATMP
jgi:hypothetical protein